LADACFDGSWFVDAEGERMVELKPLVVVSAFGLLAYAFSVRKEKPELLEFISSAVSMGSLITMLGLTGVGVISIAARVAKSLESV